MRRSIMTESVNENDAGSMIVVLSGSSKKRRGEVCQDCFLGHSDLIS